ncbi:unnamed protein product, partial [Ixodes hexagonus]
MKKVGTNMLNSVEMSCQEGTWYLLRRPMPEARREVVFVPTMWASDRLKSHEKRQQMDAEGLDADSTDAWTTNHTVVTDCMRFLQPYDEHRDALLTKFADYTRGHGCRQERMVQAQASVTANNDDIETL